MSKKRDVKLYHQDILDEIERIQRFVKGINNFEKFSKNEFVLHNLPELKLSITTMLKKLGVK